MVLCLRKAEMAGIVWKMGLVLDLIKDFHAELMRE